MRGSLTRRAVFFLFPGQFLALDLYFRGASAYLADPRLVANGLQSVVLWYLLATYRGHRAARVAMAVVVAAVLVVQTVFFRYYHAPIDTQVAASAVHGWHDIRPVLLQMLPRTLVTIAALAAVEYAALTVPAGARSRRLPLAAIFAITLFFAAPMREGTPDVRLLPSLALLVHPPPVASADAVEVPTLPSTATTLPNVLLILTESVRAEDYCSAPSDECRIAPEMNRLLPNRIPLNQMRSLASYTAVSLSAIITGRTQEVARAEIARVPNVFDLVRATRAGSVRPALAYWSAHSETVFERKDVRSRVDSWITLETLLGRNVDDEPDDDGFDRRLTERVVAEIPKLRAPSFIVLHMEGTHAPYFMDEADAPFTPYQHEVTWSGMPGLANAYRNSIHEQDKSLAVCVRAFLDHQAKLGAPWMILFTSDHGEAFGEHGGIHHGQSLWDEQIHVPGFVATSPGLLRADQESALRANATSYVTHVDLLPTILDALGVLDGFAMAPYRGALRGQSLLRRASTRAPLPITNCTGLFPCPVNTWGMLHGDVKLQAQAWDNDFRCTTVEPSPGAGETLRPTGDEACVALREASKAFFELLPNKVANR